VSSTLLIFVVLFVRLSLVHHTAGPVSSPSVARVWWPARSLVVQSFRSRHADAPDANGQLMVLARFCPWKEHLLEIEVEEGAAGATIYVLYEDAGGSWRIQTVPDRADSFSNRKPLPKQWWGASPPVRCFARSFNCF
jgi:uncharacterized UPF0160 family protein